MRILTVSKKRSQGVQLLVEEYGEKVRHYCSLDILQIKSNPKNTRYLGPFSGMQRDFELMPVISSRFYLLRSLRPFSIILLLDPTQFKHA